MYSIEKQTIYSFTTNKEVCMSIFRTIVVAGSLCAAAVYGQDLNLTATAILDDFNDEYEGDAANQTTLGAVIGIATADAAWDGGGYWYFFMDTDGTEITDSEGNQVEEGSEDLMVPDNTLIVNLNTSKSSNDYPFAGIGCVLGGQEDGNYYDLSKMTAVSLKVKCSDTVRMHFETKDIKDADYTWGWYGYVITPTSELTTITIPISDLTPEKYSEPAKDKWTWAHGKAAVNKIAFQAKNGVDAKLQLDDITLVGMTFQDFVEQTPVRVISNKVVSKGSNKFSVNSSSISFKLNKPENIKVSLTDMLGNQISTLYTGNSAAETIDLNNKNLASGRYMVVFSGKNIRHSQPVVIVK